MPKWTFCTEVDRMWTTCGRNAKIEHMHEIQAVLLRVLEEKGVRELPSLRKLAVLVGKEKISAQQVKHHLEQLDKKGFIKWDKANNFVTVLHGPAQKIRSNIVTLPYYGAVNCGPALNFAENKIEGYIKISRSLLNSPSLNDLFVVKASGNSMNKAEIGGKEIEDGDFLVVDSSKVNPSDGEIILSIIDGMANVKKIGKKENYLVLSSISTEEFPPIYIDSSENYFVNGTVIGVLKSPK